jgi:hypothetical protein
MQQIQSYSSTGSFNKSVHGSEARERALGGSRADRQADRQAEEAYSDEATVTAKKTLLSVHYCLLPPTTYMVLLQQQQKLVEIGSRVA